jgi:hypothetical protein
MAKRNIGASRRWTAPSPPPRTPPYTFKVADFGFTAAVAADTLASVTITSLPSDGTLALNGTAIADGQVITAAELAALDRQRAQKEAERESSMPPSQFSKSG